MIRCLALILLLTTQTIASAQTETTIRFAPQVMTVFPTFLGVGAAVVINDHFEPSVAFGLMPQPYYQVIGDVAASLADNSAYKDVVEAAFQNNLIWRIGLQYNFIKPEEGWWIGFANSLVNSSGVADINQVLQAGTGKDYTQLKNLLTAAGRSTQVDIEGFLLIAELRAGYSWSLAPQCVLKASGGLAKIFSADIKLETGLPNFEASAAGNSLMRSSEQELEDIVIQYGVSPILGLDLAYYF